MSAFLRRWKQWNYSCPRYECAPHGGWWYLCKYEPFRPGSYNRIAVRWPKQTIFFDNLEKRRMKNYDMPFFFWVFFFSFLRKKPIKFAHLFTNSKFLSTYCKWVTFPKGCQIFIRKCKKERMIYVVCCVECCKKLQPSNEQVFVTRWNYDMSKKKCSHTFLKKKKNHASMKINLHSQHNKRWKIEFPLAVLWT